MCTTRNIKDVKDLVFSDDFMFGAIMQDREICREVLECILDIRITRVEFPERQKSIDRFYKTRGVRLDIYVEGDDRIYEIEMQNGAEADIDERTRFYQSMIDLDFMEKGDDFSKVKECIIIFLCRFDPYKRGIPCYTFSMRCSEDAQVKSNYRVTQKIFNCTAYEKAGNPELRAFLRYVQKNDATSGFTRRISEMVEVKKEQQGFLSAYYVYKMHENATKRQAKEEGIAETKLENARNLLRMSMGTHEQIAQAVGLPLETVESLAGQSGI